ncbi:MAG: CopG family transcriptional regulator [Clostridia bacterium]|nr:CopG family transcriptional regulator [Clostridia bacterium]
MENSERIGIIGIIVEEKEVGGEAPLKIQSVLSDYAKCIVARTGVPVHDMGVSAISVIVRGKVETFSAITGKLGRIAGVSVKSLIK